MIESASTGTIFGQVSDRLVVSRQQSTSGRALRTTEIHVNDKAGSPMRQENTTSQSITVDAPNGGASDRLASDAAERNRAMIRCIPRGICSWNFLLDGAGHQGTLELGWMGEQGAITVDEIAFEVQKHGVFSGRWTLDHEGKEIGSAQKSTAFTRTFEIQDPSGELVLRAESPLGRSFRLERSDTVIATMRPDHAFTRRASIEILTKQWDLPTVYFSFWLVVLMWRRAAQSNNG